MDLLSRENARLWSLALLACAASSCLDFSLGGRRLPCPPEQMDCAECAPDGSCLRLSVNPIAPPPDRPEAARDSGQMARTGNVEPSPGPPDPTPGAPPLDTTPPPPPDAAVPAPEPCAQWDTPLGPELCPAIGVPCLSLSSELQSALVAWLDPATLRPTGTNSGYWCDRSGQHNHARHVPLTEPLRIAVDPERILSGLATSLVLDGNWMLLPGSDTLVFGREDFAILIAAAAPLEAGDKGQTYLFESDNPYQISLTMRAPDDGGFAEGRVQMGAVGALPGGDASPQTASRVSDRKFHLYTLRRLRSRTLQLRLNGNLDGISSRGTLPAELSLESGFVQTVTGIGPNDLNDTRSSSSRGRVAAVVILKGAVSDEGLGQLETYLCNTLQVCTAPSAEPIPPGSGGAEKAPAPSLDPDAGTDASAP